MESPVAALRARIAAETVREADNLAAKGAAHGTAMDRTDMRATG